MRLAFENAPSTNCVSLVVPSVKRKVKTAVMSVTDGLKLEDNDHF